MVETSTLINASQATKGKRNNLKEIFILLGLEYSGKTQTTWALKKLLGFASNRSRILTKKYGSLVLTTEITTSSLQERIIKISITTSSDQERMKYDIDKIIGIILKRLKGLVDRYNDNILVVMPFTAKYTATNYDDCIMKPLHAIEQMGIKEPRYKYRVHIIHLKSTRDSLKRYHGSLVKNDAKVNLLLSNIERLVSKLRSEGYLVEEIYGNLEAKERAQNLLEIIKTKIGPSLVMV